MADNTNTTTAHTIEIVRYDDPVIITERVAVAAFLAGYTDPTRRSYATDLRIFATWCHDHGVPRNRVARNAGSRVVAVGCSVGIIGGDSPSGDIVSRVQRIPGLTMPLRSPDRRDRRCVGISFAVTDAASAETAASAIDVKNATAVPSENRMHS